MCALVRLRQTTYRRAAEKIGVLPGTLAEWASSNAEDVSDAVDAIMESKVWPVIAGGKKPERQESWDAALNMAVRSRHTYSGNLRLPRDPKRALADMQAVQRDILAARELQS